jgi:hypothetical protein
VRDACVADVQRTDDAVVVDDGVAADAEHAIEREQPARGRLRRATIFGLDATQPVIGEEPAAIARIERGDRVAAPAQECGDLRAAREQLDELATRDVEADAVPLAARAATPASVAKLPIWPREVHTLHRARSMCRHRAQC